MVLLGGLEFVAAGYLLAEHSKHKKERKRLELQNQHLLNHAVVPQPYAPSHRRRRHSDSDRRPSGPPLVREIREKRRETERHHDSDRNRSSDKHKEHSSDSKRRDYSSDSKHHYYNHPQQPHHPSSSSSRPHKCSFSSRHANSSRLALPLASAAITSAAVGSRTNLTQPPPPQQQQPAPPRASSSHQRKSRRGSSAPPTPRHELIPYQQPTPLHQHYRPVAPPPYPAYSATSVSPSRTRPSNHSYPPPTPMVPSSSASVPAPHTGSGGSGRNEAAGHSYVPPREDAWELPASEVGRLRPSRAGAMSPHVHFEDGLSTLKEPIEPPPPYREY